MKEQGYADVILRFLRSVLFIDALLGGVIGVLVFLLGFRTPEAYGSALIRTGMIVIFVAIFTGAGGLTARAGDVGAYTLSGAGNMSEHMLHVAESRRSSLGCLFLMLVAGFGLIAVGYLLPVFSAFLGE